MKKLFTIMAAAVLAGSVHAAATNWQLTAGNLKDSTGAAFAGLFELYATGGDLLADTLVYSNPSSGAVYNKFAFTVEDGVLNDSGAVTYDFYYKLTDAAAKSFISETKTGFTPVSVGATTISWGNQATATTEGTWTAAPEPTSGILLLLGMAGLALKRKRA